MNVNQAIEALQEMINARVITGEEEFGAFINCGETFLPTTEFKTFENPDEQPVVYMRFLIDTI